jgi:hypothetical protein
MNPSVTAASARPLVDAGRLVWAAAWRAQVAHLALFAALPLLIVAARIAAGLLFVPALVTGPGDRHVELAVGADHLRDASCWIALAPCTRADDSLHDFEVARRPAARDPRWEPAAFVATPHEPFLPVPESITWRHGWFALWLVWFLAYLALRRPRKPSQ